MRRIRVVLGGLVAGVTFGLLAASCVVDDDSPPGLGPGTGASSNGGSGGDAPGCVEGESRTCHVTVGEHEGVLTCYTGVQYCADGVWGTCTDGTIVDHFLPTPSHAGTPRALSDAGPCQDNPCDPSCQVFDEVPDAGLVPDAATPVFDWVGGSLGGMPAGLVNKGLTEPCSRALDCQFDYYCKDPTSGTCAHSKCQTGTGLQASCDPCVTDICAADPTCCPAGASGTCSHAKCSSGSALVSGCDPCVTQICAADPFCCSTAPGGNCSHNPCKTGGKLNKNCSACTTAVCNADPYCCNTSWDSLCVSEVASICGITCGSWDAQCVAEVTSICNQGCGGGTWDQGCVDMVNTVCGAFCDNDDGTGQCEPWLPGQTNPECAGVDLTVGVPCAGSIPVCNRGNTEVPAGVKIVHFPANSQQYPKCAPDQTHPQMKTCFTSEPIPPGMCIDVTTCPGLVGNREIMVNPQPTAQAECSCQDNWSLFSGGTCEPPTCSATTGVASKIPVNMYVMFDRSGSMQSNNKWNLATNALEAFFEDPGSAGLRVALRFFPSDVPTAGCYAPACSRPACADPLVDLGTLTAASAPTDSHELALVNAINATSANGSNTPIYAALGGALDFAVAYKQANPNEQSIVVLVTDGLPNGCNNNMTTISNLAATAFQSDGVLTYAIGLEGSAPAQMNQIAAAGGTGTGFFIGNGGNVTQEFIDAMKTIQLKSASCDLLLPNVGNFDPNAATVVFTPTVGSPQTLPQQANAAGCGSGWYYDDPVNPTRITLCPSTCGVVQADTTGKVEVVIGCPYAYEPLVHTETYVGTCPAGTTVQWGYLAYSTLTPGDSNVVFRARVAPTDADLGSASYVGLATAQSSPDTQVCPMGGPAPCPIDLFDALGGLPAAQYPALELELTLNPSTDGQLAPTVNSWNITYSCPPNE